MAKKDHLGRRKNRSAKRPIKIPKLGYYLIVTDAEATEKNYFDGFYKNLPDEIQKKITIKVLTGKKYHRLVQSCKEEATYSAQYCRPWIVFDRDLVPEFDQIIHEAHQEKIDVGWSNPCFEEWMFAYFGMMPKYTQSIQCVNAFKKEYEKRTNMAYVKAEQDVYKKLITFGDENKAIRLAEMRMNSLHQDGIFHPSEMFGCTTVFQLIKEIREKVK